MSSTRCRGRHTTTAVQGRMLPGVVWIFDTPGVRSFGLAHVSAEQIVDSFEDLSPLTSYCPRGCTHLESEPECALDTAVRAGTIAPERVAGLRRLLAGKNERPERGPHWIPGQPDAGSTGYWGNRMRAGHIALVPYEHGTLLSR